MRQIGNAAWKLLEDLSGARQQVVRYLECDDGPLPQGQERGQCQQRPAPGDALHAHRAASRRPTWETSCRNPASLRSSAVRADGSATRISSHTRPGLAPISSMRSDRKTASEMEWVTNSVVLRWR